MSGGPGQQQNPKAQVKKQSTKYKTTYLQKHNKKNSCMKKCLNHQTHNLLTEQTKDDYTEEKTKPKVKMKKKKEHSNRGNNSKRHQVSSKNLNDKTKTQAQESVWPDLQGGDSV